LAILLVCFLESRRNRPTAEAEIVEWMQKAERGMARIQLGTSKMTDYNRLLSERPKRLKVNLRARMGVLGWLLVIPFAAYK